MNKENETLIIDKEMWDTLVAQLHELTEQVSALQQTLHLSPQYYSNKELRSLLGIEDKLIRKYRDEGLLAYTKVGDKYWYRQQDVTDFLENSRQAAFA